MAKEPFTEAERKARQTQEAEGHPVREGGGQRSSQERGSHTRSKKNPGKRPHGGG